MTDKGHQQRWVDILDRWIYLLYVAEKWVTTKRQETRIEVNEMRMLRWMCGVTRKDKIRNEHTRGKDSDIGFQKDHGEAIKLVRACDEERW